MRSIRYGRYVVSITWVIANIILLLSVSPARTIHAEQGTVLATETPYHSPTPYPYTFTPTFTYTPAPYYTTAPEPTLTPQPTQPTPTSSGQMLVVNTLQGEDGVCDRKHCSLTDAIESADWGATIRFAVGLKGVTQIGVSINKNLTIVGPGPKSDAIIVKDVGTKPNTVVNISYLTFANASLSPIFNMGTLTISNCTFRNNVSMSGGAITNLENGIINIYNSTFQSNIAGGSGGAIVNHGQLLVVNSTFEGNKALHGGAIANMGIAKVINSTFEGNEAIDADMPYKTPTTIQNANDAMKLVLQNSIIVGQADELNCEGNIEDGGGNIQSDGTNCVSTIPVGDPKLASLADNGGATQTMALQLGSAAINRGVFAICKTAPVFDMDQRGVT